MPTESGTIKFVQTATIKSWYGDSLRYAKRSRGVALSLVVRWQLVCTLEYLLSFFNSGV